MQPFEHGGNIHKILRQGVDERGEVLDFSANINPLGPPEWFRPMVSRSLDGLVHYPDPENTRFIEAVATFHGIAKEQVVVGNGTTELLYLLPRILGAKRALIPTPSYVDYMRALSLGGMSAISIAMDEKDDFALDCTSLAKSIAPDDLVILATPNNPTGALVDRDLLLGLINDFPRTRFIVDEAFLDFVAEGRSLAAIADNVITLNSMTKFYGVPGLRIGYATMSTQLAAEMRRHLPPWTVNGLAQEFAVMALADSEYQRRSRENCDVLRRDLIAGLSVLPQLKVYPGVANYLFFKVCGEKSGDDLAQFCLQRSLVIRRCGNYQGLDHRYCRIAVRTADENARLLDTFAEFFAERKPSKAKAKKARSIMFQGTCSDAGKSILTAALCRILRQDGVAVAPFKAQNMSLNSFVTREEHEMGRAQVVQAQAARIDPDSRMNPILLKPNSDTGSQVIVRGKSVGNMTVNEYTSYKPKIWQTVCDCYDSLAKEYEVVVLEGAGSPGEVNLKAEDIVNMRMAQYAAAPVVVVGDIDRGGVYASFVGIMEVLAEWERKMVAGFVVNKFRGQASLLQSAHDYVLRHTGRPVLGVVPYMSDLALPEEDSVSFKKGAFNRSKGGGAVEIAVISLPHISNFTDIEPFLQEPDVTVTIVDSLSQLGRPQAVILPGSKNVLHDLRFLHDQGFSAKLLELLHQGCEIVGICGGYQMLGEAVKDPYGIESGEGPVAGLGLLPITTIIEREKRLTRKSGIHHPSGMAVVGYEIHHGVSPSAEHPLLHFDDGSSCGLAVRHGRVWGSYLHGIFDQDQFRRWFIDNLRRVRGLETSGVVVAPYDLEQSFERLAEEVRRSLDMSALYRLLRL
jgi:adenosylcobyric acid synthase